MELDTSGIRVKSAITSVNFYANHLHCVVFSYEQGLLYSSTKSSVEATYKMLNKLITLSWSLTWMFQHPCYQNTPLDTILSHIPPSLKICVPKIHLNVIFPRSCTSDQQIPIIPTYLWIKSDKAKRYRRNHSPIRTRNAHRCIIYITQAEFAAVTQSSLYDRKLKGGERKKFSQL
jgi:hypothetical protein